MYGSLTARAFVLASWLGSAKRSGAPATLYFALLYSVSPADSLGTEATGGGYARAAKTNNDALWDLTGTGEVATTLLDVVWPMSTASWSGNPLNQWAVYDAASAGNCWAFGELTDALDMTAANRVPTAAAGDIIINQGE